MNVIPLLLVLSHQNMSQRVDDLVSKMTLEEKIGQMMHQAPAIPRLGVKAYDWWNEALHGIARPGNTTVFPQSIGLAATFDTDLVNQIGAAISDEARARYNFERTHGDQGWNQGLDFWAPNINIFRDPRWGRGQETYGEDPFLTSRMGVAYITGMQGTDLMHLKTICTPKHYAVHSGPDPLRHTMNTVASARDMWLTYLPAFEACLTEAHAWSTMSAYNRVNGEPCSGSKVLLKDILRDRWHFQGYVVSDCGAIWDILNGHKVVKTAEEAAALAVNMGCDLECGDSYRALQNAVSQGLISENTINKSVKRLMEARMRLGMFDTSGPYDSIGMSVVDSPKHRALARMAARESIVLLKNERNLLPLKKNLRTIAVVGPNADSKSVLLGNYHGSNKTLVTPLQGIRNAASSTTKVLYAKGCGLTSTSELAPVPASALRVKGEYFANKDFKGEPAAVRNDAAIDFDWGDDAPAPNTTADDFSVRWAGTLTAPVSGKFQLGMTCDDGMRVSIDDKLVLNDWREGAARTTSTEITLQKGVQYKLRVEFYERGGQAVAKLLWALPNQKPFDEALAIAKQADVVVMALGIDTSVEDEEHDRTDIGVPKVQQDLMKAVHATGKPLVLLLLNGGPISDVWSHDNVPAILEAWYPGEEGGNAIADVLFGEYNPSGRLPVSIVRSMADLPDFANYDMSRRTYRYSPHPLLYMFGFGLSYTQFKYEKLNAPKQLAIGTPLRVSVDVTNTGRLPGDEVVQVYIHHRSSSKPMPTMQLVVFKRIHLRAGEKQTVQLTINAAMLAVLHDDTHLWQEPEAIDVFVNGCQPRTHSLDAFVKFTGPQTKVK